VSETDEERRKRMATNSAAHLANGTWPQVLSVFGYENPRAPRVDPETYQKLRNVFEAAGCAQIAAFAGLVSIEERARGMTMSFNFSLCRRRQPGNVQDSEESLMDHLGTPDMLIGTRKGVEGAAVWLEKFASTLASQLPPESIQFMDKIFGEAVACMLARSQRLTLEDLVDIASGQKTLDGSPEPTKQ
jgi:hypothetical protein